MNRWLDACLPMDDDLSRKTNKDVRGNWFSLTHAQTQFTTDAKGSFTEKANFSEQLLDFLLERHRARENRNTEFFIDGFKNASVCRFFVPVWIFCCSRSTFINSNHQFHSCHSSGGRKLRYMSLETLIDVCHLNRLFCWCWSLDFSCFPTFFAHISLENQHHCPIFFSDWFLFKFDLSDQKNRSEINGFAMIDSCITKRWFAAMWRGWEEKTQHPMKFRFCESSICKVMMKRT